MISGIINVLKPAGLTSNAVLSKLKKILKPNKIGHLGTLDPSATGVLPVCINKATKLFDFYLKKDKHYKAVFVFGKQTDTLDSDGVVIDVNDNVVTPQMIESVLPNFVGKQNQMPPKFSAKKINGKNAYELARNNVDFDLQPKQIEIYSIKAEKCLAKNTFLFDIKCSSGTYIRSLARDIAKSLGTFGYMGALIRVASGNFDIENSVLIEQIDQNCIIPLTNCLKDIQNVFVSSKFYDKIINGCSVPTQADDCDTCVVFCKEQLIGIGNVHQHILKIKTYLWEKND